MSANLSTPITRAVFALPLLAIGLAVAFGAGAQTGRVIVLAHHAGAPQVPMAPARGVAATLPTQDLLAVADTAGSCSAAPAGARGLARMPGDISTLAGRLRCAQ